MPGLNLTREEAIQRADVICVDHYDVELDLTRGDKDFFSRTTVTFSATEGETTFADLVSNNVHSIVLNGEHLDPLIHQDHRIALPQLAAHNTLTVEADCQYMHTGEGLHRFVDPADSQAYCYSQFEVPDARRVFTTFEQPDLKATFTFTVTVPAGWKVFSNSATPEPEMNESSWTYRFEETERISTYITAIIAGPYQGVTDSLVSSDGRTIPLGVWCRASLLDSLDSDRILDITRAGFTFFEDAYGIPYPFKTYDQIFVPEYNAGAMENAGCVTFRDQYIFRTRPTTADLEARANTILHELAHMWFGDLVTMKWWNDLWLNESFAEFMSHLALAEATEYTEGWTGFMLRKDWGMNQDQLPTTHPITAEIRDLADVEVNFDGITYAKGASVLRQLVTYVGREHFFAGLHEYLTKHSYSNATLADLLGELEKASGRDLKQWSRVWLEEAGITLLRPQIDVYDNGAITQLKVIQEPFSEGSSLRPHRLIVSGYSQAEDGSIERVFSQELDVDGSSTVVSEATGIARPDLILINDQDLAYAKVRLDPQSLDFAIRNIARFEDSLTRGVILASAWDMTRDGEMPARDYLLLLLSALPAERNATMLRLYLRHLDQALETYVAPARRRALQERVASALLIMARTASAHSDEQQLFVRELAHCAILPEHFEAVRGLYEGTETLMGLDLDVDLRWTLLTALVRGGVAGEAEIAALEAEDDTMTGHQKAAAARAAVADIAVKQQVWDAVLRDTSIPNDTRWAMVSGFWAQARTTPEMYVPVVADYFDSLQQIWRDHTFHIAEDIVTLMFPKALACYVEGLDLVAQGTRWIQSHQDASAALIRLLREQISTTERMLGAQAADA
ncbi:aminopeptidase N [Actinomyces sp. S6-Spd3]|uniref:aminopeptidase N n=1 Tax=Actinomyces sp. S6-Spd3 TaxID=1284680 RepID=UPI0005100319|nr:aminopeptidase N [Actinomyces sp. S6-Spd3]KGF00546.1 aminopeptidase N [Actinomyces sp. S6-Spd3]